MSVANHALHGDPIDPKKKKAGAETSGDTRKYLYGSSEQSALEDFLFEPSYIQGGGGAMELLALGPAKGAKWLLKLFGARGIKKIPANRLNHIFGKSEHALDGLVEQYGSQSKAYSAVHNAANHALKSGKLTPNANGILPSGNAGNIINVGGTSVRLIGGRVVDGKIVLSSFSRKGL